MTFENRRLELFGRDPDVEFLIHRAQIKGFTAVVGPPQIGKSWLVTEVARRLSEEEGQLVGYAERVGHINSMVPQALCDLYVRWLADASHRCHARRKWERYRTRLSSETAEAVGRIFQGLERAVTPGALGRLVKDSLGTLGTDLGAPSPRLTQLDDEQACELTNLVVNLSERRVTLILDAWEPSFSGGWERWVLKAFLDRLDDWHRCHLFACLRPEGAAWTQAPALQDASPAACVFHLPMMHLDPEDERQMLTCFLQQRVPATRSLRGDELLELIQGFPGVLERWLDASRRGRLIGLVQLRSEAESARRYHYPEVYDLLPTLSFDERRFAMLLALFLPIEHEASKVYRNTWFDGLDADLVFALRAKKVIEDPENFPYGHGIRQAAVCRWFCSNYQAQMTAEVEALVFRLGGRVKALDSTAWPFLLAVAALARVAGLLPLSAAARAVVAAAASLSPGGLSEPLGMHLVLAAGRDAMQKERRVAPVISMALFNGLIRATAQGDMNMSDLLLNGLRGLHRGWPEDVALREALAVSVLHALAATIDDPGRAITDPFLDELRGLHRDWPEDPALREALTLGLLNASIDVTAAGNAAHGEALLEEMHYLQQRWPGDASTDEVFAPFAGIPGVYRDDEVVRCLPGI